MRDFCRNSHTYVVTMRERSQAHVQPCSVGGVSAEVYAQSSAVVGSLRGFLSEHKRQSVLGQTAARLSRFC